MLRSGHTGRHTIITTLMVSPHWLFPSPLPHFLPLSECLHSQCPGLHRTRTYSSQSRAPPWHTGSRCSRCPVLWLYTRPAGSSWSAWTADTPTWCSRTQRWRKGSPSLWDRAPHSPAAPPPPPLPCRHVPAAGNQQTSQRSRPSHRRETSGRSSRSKQTWRWRVWWRTSCPPCLCQVWSRRTCHNPGEMKDSPD